jgi:hypothetical protein
MPFKTSCVRAESSIKGELAALAFNAEPVYACCGMGAYLSPKL